MAINSFPSGIKGVIEQTNFLEREFKEALHAELAYRMAAEKEPVPNRVGETVTKSRPGLRPAVTVALNPSGNTNFDNGLTSSQNIFEQYTVAINRYGDTIDLDATAEKTLIASLFVQNVKDMADQAARSLDSLAAQTLYTAYDAGNTYVTTTAGSVTSIAVDNINGFDTTYPFVGLSPAAPTATSSGNTLAGTWYAGGAPPASATAITITGVTVDGSNTSTAQSGGVVYGRSGHITVSSAISVTAGDVIVAKDGAVVIRGGSKGSRYALGTGDLITLQTLVLARAKLAGRGVRPLKSTGRYLCIVDEQLLAQLWLDAAFQRAAEGGFVSEAFKMGVIRLTMGMDVVTSNFTPSYTATNGTARHGIVLGDGAVVEAPFMGATQAAKEQNADGISDVRIVDDIVFLARPPMDRLGMIVAQSWRYDGGFVAPTDITTGPSVIPGSDNARYKRGVMLEALA